MNAKEACKYLGITPATLYSYVSRGLIRSESTTKDHRIRRYYTEDLDQLKLRKAQRGNPDIAAKQALDWGSPILESAITLIADNKLYYRGQDAIELAQNAEFEEVAQLLWDEDEHLRLDWYANPDVLRVPSDILELPFIPRFQAILAYASTQDKAAFATSPQNQMQTGVRILELMTMAATGKKMGLGIGIAEHLAVHWAGNKKHAQRLIDAALILCADHELNISAFTARCVASAGSPLYAVVQAGLAALQGYKHGGHTERVQALLDEIKSPGKAQVAISRRLKLGESIPGFGHKLYPEGDPRAALLLESSQAATRRNNKRMQRITATSETVERLTEKKPALDTGLVAVAEALKLPEGAPLALFAIGRTAGWIGQAIEQYGRNQLIRPRARYTGVQPEILQ